MNSAQSLENMGGIGIRQRKERGGEEKKNGAQHSRAALAVTEWNV